MTKTELEKQTQLDDINARIDEAFIAVNTGKITPEQFEDVRHELLEQLHHLKTELENEYRDSKNN